MRIKNNIFKVVLVRVGKKVHVITILVLCTFLVINFLIHNLKKSVLLTQWKNTSLPSSFSASAADGPAERIDNESSSVSSAIYKVQDSFSDIMSHNNIITRRFPYLREPLCQNFSLSLYEDETFPLVGLVSFPGSGNTWVRHLIQMATGVYTGSFYFDVDLFAGGFLGEREIWHSGRTIVQKFHEKYTERMYLDKAVLLIREPFPAILAFANYLEAGHTGNSFRLPFHHKDWSNFLLQSAYNWLSLAKSWIESPVSLLVIHYEDLFKRPRDNVQSICNFLNHSCQYLSSPCFQSKLEGTFKRTKIKRLKDATRQSRYPASVQSVVSRGIDHLNHLLLQNNLQPIPIHLYKYYRRSDSVNHNSSVNT